MVIEGTRYYLVPPEELSRLERLAARAVSASENPAPLPPADAQGNRPAAVFMQAAIARSIFKQRTALGLSQEQLARLAGVRQETVCRLESGKHSPTVRTVQRIEKALHQVARRTRRS